jgi:outer membrane biosynthesis protein TonB
MTQEKIMTTRFPQLSLAIALGAALALPLLAEDLFVANEGATSVTSAIGIQNNDQKNSGTPAALILLNNENK